jgi:hypothetical protein
MTNRFTAHATAAAALLMCIALPTHGGQEAPLQLSGTGPYYQLELPLAWQARASRADLADLRVLNAQGQSLPYAWLATPDPVAVEQQSKVALFKWSGPKAPGGALAAHGAGHGASAATTNSPPASPTASTTVSPTSSSWPIWVMDLRNLPGQIRQLQLSLPPTQIGIFALAVETSADLQSWTTVIESVQLAQLAHEGQTLHQDVIELGGLRAPYMRLRLLPGSPEPTLSEATVTTMQNTVSTPPWSWSGPLRAVSCGTNYCDYPMPAHVALGRLKVHLTEPNTLMTLQVLGQEAAQTATLGERPAHHHHGLRARMHALRHKSAGQTTAATPSADEPAGWTPVTEGQVHWIEQASKQVRAEELALDNAHYPTLRLRTPAGDASWTRHPPAIEVATWSRALVFLSRGAQPYRVSWAVPDAAGNVPAVALPMAQLVPNQGTGQALEHGRATLPEAVSALTQVTPASASSPGGISPQGTAPGGTNHATRTDARDERPASRIPQAWWLWAALLLGVGVMAYMARALLSPAHKQP